MTWGAAAYVMKSSDEGKRKEKIREALEKRGFPLKRREFIFGMARRVSAA